MEGIGAALMLPAMVALIAGNYPAGIERTKAYAVLAMVGSSAAAIGPIVGGIFTTYLSWRLAFFSELFVVAFIVLNRQIIKDAIYQGKAPSFDFKGFILTVTGFVSLVGDEKRGGITSQRFWYRKFFQRIMEFNRII
jgi:MFS family permease